MRCTVLGCVEQNLDGDRFFCVPHRSLWRLHCVQYGLSSFDLPFEDLLDWMLMFQGKEWKENARRDKVDQDRD